MMKITTIQILHTNIIVLFYLGILRLIKTMQITDKWNFLRLISVQFYDFVHE